MPHRPYQGPSAQVFVVDTIELLTFPVQHYTSIRDDMKGPFPLCHIVYCLFPTWLIIILSIDLLSLSSHITDSYSFAFLTSCCGLVTIAMRAACPRSLLSLKKQWLHRIDWKQRRYSEYLKETFKPHCNQIKMLVFCIITGISG